MLNILRFANEQNNLTAFSKLYYRLRGYYISKKMLDNCNRKDVDANVFENILDHNALNEYQQDNVRKLRRNFETLAKKSPSEGIDYLLDIMGYREFLMDRAGSSDATFDTYMDMVIVLRNLAKDCKDLEEVMDSIRSLEALMKQASENEGADAVTLSTVHSSKGLEWDRIYLIDLQEGIFPNRDVVKMAASGDQTALEEERRLFYVAMTRAKRQLKLMRIKDAAMSLFVREVEEILFPEKKLRRLEVEKTIRKAVIEEKGNSYGSRVGAKPAYWGVDSLKDHQTDTADLELAEQFEIGVPVTHKRFGQGTVVSCDNRHITITFDGRERKLELGFSVRQGLLSLS